MRCLCCGIRLKIAEKAKAIEHCPECSVGVEYENRRDALLRAAITLSSVQANNKKRLAAFASLKSV
jgi:hypothetical protein